MKNYKMNRVAFEEKIRGGEYISALSASRAVGKAAALSKEERVQLKTLIKEHFINAKSKAYLKIERRFSGKKRYASLSYAQRAIGRSTELTKIERQELLEAATSAFAKKAPPQLSEQDKTIRRGLSKVFFKKKPFFEIFNEVMSNTHDRELISSFCLSAIEAEGDGVSLPSIVEVIKRRSKKVG